MIVYFGLAKCHKVYACVKVIYVYVCISNVYKLDHIMMCKY